MVEFVNEKFHLPGWRAMSSTYDANNSGWYEAYMELEKILGSLDNTLSAFGGAGFCPISENVDRLFDGFAALSFCRDNLEYELFVEIDEKLMKQFGEMTDEFATLDVRNIRTPNVLGIQEIQVCHDAEGNIASETEVGTVSYLTLENFTGAAGFENTSGYKEQCITGFSKMLEKQYNFYVDEGVLDRNVKLHEYLNGMMPHEFEYSQYTEVWKKTVHSFLDVLVVPTMIEAVTGVEFITGDHLTDNEQAGKAVQSLIQAVSIGMTAGGAYSKGITYVTAGKMQSSQISKYAACKVMKSVAEDGVMNMVTTELTEHDCELAARVLMFASMYVGMQEAPDFVDRYVEDGGMVKNNKADIDRIVKGIINGENEYSRQFRADDYFVNQVSGKGDVIKPKNILNELNKSEIGQETLELIIQNDLKINLIYDVVPDEYTLGETFWSTKKIYIYVKNTKTIKETTGTIIHEVTHVMYGNPLNSIKEEFLCYLRAELHKKPSLSLNEMKSILKQVKNLYPELHWRWDK